MNKKIRKFISKGLIVSTLFVNTPINSLAGILSEDTRYETFEGDSIMINDILEEDRVDVEIEGNTLVNLIDEGVVSSFNHGTVESVYHTTETEFIYNPLNSDKNFSQFQIYGALEKLVDKTYTMILNFDNADTSGTGNGMYIGINNNSYTGNTKFVPKNVNGTYKIVFTMEKKTESSIKNNYLQLGYYGFPSKCSISKKIVILEGDWTNKEIPECFEGMKSVGELEGNKIEVASKNKNLYQYGVRNGSWKYGNNTKYNVFDKDAKSDTGSRISNILPIPIKPNTRYKLKVDGFDGILHHFFYDKNGDYLNKINFINSANGIITTPENAFYMCFFSGSNFTDINANVVFSLDLEAENTLKHKSDKKEIILKEPLRGLPNGIKDRIIKKNGQWVVERNCGEVVFDGTEEWYISEDKYMNVLAFYTKSVSNFKSSLNGTNLISDSFKTSKYYDDEEGITSNKNTDLNSFPSNIMRIKIKSDKLSSKDVEGLKKWLSKNSVKVVYQLSSPMYEKLKIGPTLKTYIGRTYMLNNSTIPANMSVRVSRIANRAKESIEAAKLKPTAENLSLARMWINLMKESILKDEFNDIVNNVYDIEDLQMDKQTVTANLDVYIKSENLLSMSLDTNSVVFDNYSGIDEMEKLKAINISINSSLPYSLNAYIPSEIKNMNNSKVMNLGVLNIKESGEGAYKTFDSISSKLILKDDCVKGNNKTHSIDLKLASDLAHEADVYKTVLKFEAEQK